MVSRTTDDYERMAAAGIVACIEPSFWLGQPRTNVGSYIDYLSLICGFERFRAGQFGLRHYCTVGLNPKEANNEELAEAVMSILPRYALKEGVVAIGEIGYDEQTALEDRYYRAQLDLAKELALPVMIHTPHRDKHRGTLRSMAVALEHGLDPSFVVIDHNNEETVRDVLDRGFWAAFSIYPHTKMGNERMVEIVRTYGAERIFCDSACDWGVSDPLAMPKTAELMRRGGISEVPHPQGHLRQSAGGLWQERPDQRAGLAKPIAHRPADALYGQLRVARRTGAEDRGGAGEGQCLSRGSEDCLKRSAMIERGKVHAVDAGEVIKSQWSRR